MTLSTKDVKDQLNGSAAKLNKLAGDFLHIAEANSVDGLKAIKNLRQDAEAGKTSFVEASKSASNLASEMASELERLEANEAGFDLAAHQDACDMMVEALLSLRGQARRTSDALERHLAKRRLEEEANLLAEAKAGS